MEIDESTIDLLLQGELIRVPRTEGPRGPTVYREVPVFSREGSRCGFSEVAQVRKINTHIHAKLYTKAVITYMLVQMSGFSVSQEGTYV